VAWTTEPTAEFDAWFDSLSPEDKEHIVAAVIYLEETGPNARCPCRTRSGNRTPAG
jgi:hypothetical protein